MRLGRRDFGPSLDVLVVGLGTPGPEYAATRHNLGFMVTDRLAAEWSLGWRSKFSARVAEGRDGDKRLALLQPQTYMTLSGQSVAATSNEDMVAASANVSRGSRIQPERGGDEPPLRLVTDCPAASRTGESGIVSRIRGGIR